jgi:hypothetical protein
VAQYSSGGFSPGVKWLGREADLSVLCSFEAKINWSCTYGLILAWPGQEQLYLLPLVKTI